MLCTVVELMQPNCTIVAKETSESGTLTLPAYTPPVNRSKTVPTGHPEIITENFDEDISNYFGLIKCTVLLPHQNEDHSFKKRRFLAQNTVKFDCPARIHLSEVIKFPELKVLF